MKSDCVSLGEKAFDVAWVLGDFRGLRAEAAVLVDGFHRLVEETPFTWSSSGRDPWLQNRQVITSLDLAKRETILPGLHQVHWDVVIVDEAHRMSWSPPARKTARYALGELLRDHSDHILLLTATPHKGDPEHFSRFLQLLDEDAYANVKSVRQAIEQRSAPFYLRRTKEAMVYFHERQSDGSWKARKIFTKRDTRTADFTIDNEELRLLSGRDFVCKGTVAERRATATTRGHARSGS